jgi:hypothetical protein
MIGYKDRQGPHCFFNNRIIVKNFSLLIPAVALYARGAARKPKKKKCAALNN